MKLNSISSKQNNFIGTDEDGMGRLRDQLAQLDQKKLHKLKEDQAKAQSVKVIVKGQATKKEKIVGVNDKKQCKEVLKGLFNKNSSNDLFQDILINGKPIYEPHPIQKRIKNKIERGQLERKLRRLILIS